MTEECKNDIEYYKKRCELWESLAVSKSRELSLMTKVADLWQDKLIKANERIAELENDRTSASD